MKRWLQSLQRHKCELLVGLLRVVLYAGLGLCFFGMMSIRNWPLRHLSRTLATTLLTWAIATLAMHAVYGGYDVGKRKDRPIISGLSLAVLFTDLITYVQLQIMNVNENNNATLQLFGPDLLLLAAALAAQLALILLLVRYGNRLYFSLVPPRRCLLIADDPRKEAAMREKLQRYRLQWQVTDAAPSWAADLPRRAEEAELVVLADVPPEKREALMRMCYDAHRDVICRTDLQDILLNAAEPLIIDDAPCLSMPFYKMKFSQRVIRRVLDVVISLLVLTVTAPLMAVIALFSRLEDGGPAIFRQERATIGGRVFSICKFRTMKVEASNQAHQVSAEKDDDRITRVGRVLRNTRLDELPQFWNILKGDMTIVGPRPEMLDNVERYKKQYPDFVYREKAKAGLTGYAQIEGRYNTTAEDKLMLDLMYIENNSLWSDLRLMLRTLTVFFRKDSTEGFERREEE